QRKELLSGAADESGIGNAAIVKPSPTDILEGFTQSLKTGAAFGDEEPETKIQIPIFEQDITLPHLSGAELIETARNQARHQEAIIVDRMVKDAEENGSDVKTLCEEYQLKREE